MEQYDKLTTYLTEKFQPQMAPVGLFPAGDIGGKTVYSSVKMQEEYLKIIQGSKLLRPVADILVKLVKNWIVVPCYMSKNLISFYATKFLLNVDGGGTVAFYHPINNKVYATFEMQISSLMDIDHKFAAGVLLHELQHFCATNLKQKQYSLFSKMYHEWYKHFFNAYFKTNKITIKDVEPISLFLAKTADWTPLYDTKQKSWAKAYYTLLDKLTDKHKLDKKPIQLLLGTIFMFMKNPRDYMAALQGKKDPHISLYLSCMEAYQKMGHKVHTVAVQELIVPSEIACMTSENKPQPIHYKAIRMLDSLNIKA